jgi:hypothetical protein
MSQFDQLVLESGWEQAHSSTSPLTSSYQSMMDTFDDYEDGGYATIETVKRQDPRSQVMITSRVLQQSRLSSLTHYHFGHRDQVQEIFSEISQAATAIEGLQ